MHTKRVRPKKEKDRLKLDSTKTNHSKSSKILKNHYTLENGYNMLEIVIAVGLILILSAGGILIFSGITADAKLAKVTSAAKNIYIAAITSQLDNDPETSPTETADRYNDSNESITIKIREIGEPPADWETAPNFSPQSGDEFCIAAIWNDQPEIKGYAGVCSITDNGGSIIPPGDGGDYIWDTRATMTTTWDTSLGANCEEITLPVGGVKPGATVDWGDGAGAVAFAATGPNYGNSGVKTIIIAGEFDSWGSPSWSDANCLTQVTQWGNTGTTNLMTAFMAANNLTLVKAIPETTENLLGAFLINTGNPDISGIRTPNVTNMGSIFAATPNFNQPLNNFDTSNVTDMSRAFQQTGEFNQPLTNFKTSNVKNMNGMFNDAKKFDQPVNFNTENVTDMEFMFDHAISFNQPIDFNSKNVENMSQMFLKATKFNKSLKLNTSSVTNMRAMFDGASSFNQPLNFDTSNVTNMAQIFNGATDFNQNLSGWNVSKVSSYESFDIEAPNWVLPKPNFN